MYWVYPTLELRGKRKFRTCWGASCSCLALLIIFLYAALKVLSFQSLIPDSQFARDAILFVHDELQVLVVTPQAFTQIQELTAAYELRQTEPFPEEIPESEEPAPLEKLIYLSYAEIAADVGGFSIIVYFLIGLFVNSFNQKMFLKSIIEDTYIVKKNEDLTSEKIRRPRYKGRPPPRSKNYEERSQSAPNSARASKRTGALSPVPEEDEGSNVEIMLEGGTEVSDFHANSRRGDDARSVHSKKSARSVKSVKQSVKSAGSRAPPKNPAA